MYYYQGIQALKRIYMAFFLFFVRTEYCEQIEPPVRMIEPASAINRATQCERESH